jgi:hypothetical protein
MKRKIVGYHVDCESSAGKFWLAAIVEKMQISDRVSFMPVAAARFIHSSGLSE